MADEILTQDYLKSIFEYKDGELFWKISKKGISKNKKCGYLNNRGYYMVGLNNKDYGVHRIIYFMFNGYFPEFVDHKDGNKFNNKIENLRPATMRENNLNVKTKISNTSRYKNVCWNKEKQKWHVKIRHDGKNKHFGYYYDIEIAKFIAETMRNKYHGKFACHV
jgi:HNH endonuclease